jgi:hypothetical protein
MSEEENNSEKKKIVVVPKDVFEELSKAQEEVGKGNVAISPSNETSEVEDLKQQLENLKSEKEELKDTLTTIAEKELHQNCVKYGIDESLPDDEKVAKIKEIKHREVEEGNNTANVYAEGQSGRSNSQKSEEEFIEQFGSVIGAKNRILLTRVSNPSEAIAKLQEFARYGTKEEREFAEKTLTELTKKALDDRSRKIDMEVENVHDFVKSKQKRIKKIEEGEK